MTNNINLKPNLELLNSNFDGYKLRSDPNQSVYTRKIEDGVFQQDISDVTCYLYTRLESLHNHLINDPFEPYSVYVFNAKGHLLMFHYKDGFVSPASVVWQEDLHNRGEKGSETTYCFSPSLSFSSSHIAVTSNGQGLLNILQTGDRTGDASWVKLRDLKVAHGSIVSSLLVEQPEGGANQQQLHVLLLGVVPPQDIEKDPLHPRPPECFRNSKALAVHIVYWLTFDFDGENWELARERRLAGFKSLEFLSLDLKGCSVVLLSHDNYHFLYDSALPIEGKEEEEAESKQKKAPLYLFMQNSEEVKLWIHLGHDVPKEDVGIEVRTGAVKVKVKGKVFLEREFSRPVDDSGATWIIDKDRIEITVPKATDGIEWETLFEGGDADGEMILDAGRMEDAGKMLANLISDQWNPNSDPEKAAYDPGQLEACDDASEDLYLAVMDGTTHATSHSAHLGSVQHLFNVQLEDSVIPSFCLRHDVDGLLWQLQEDCRLVHNATFHAFGYVKASKAMAKFTRAAIDCSYVAVADVKSHVYIFFQPSALGTELRNRKSGKLTTTIARQLIISLRNHREVLGFHTAPNCIFVLTSAELFVYSLDTGL